MARAIGVVAALVLGCIPARAPASPGPHSCAEAWADVADAGRAPAAGESYARFAERLPRQGCTKAWTVLVFMAAGAGDLVAPSARDLRSMEAPGETSAWSAASTVQADVIVELHRLDPRDVRRIHLFRAGAAEATDVASPVVETLDQEAVPLEESLRRFVSWGALRYPADRYAVIVWGHGLGWRPASAGGGPVHYDRAGDSGGIAFDEGRGMTLDTPALARALGSASRERLGGRPFDLYASDACLMQSVEVAGELAAAARYVVGSEQIEEDYLGLPYRAWLPILNGSAPMPAAPGCPPADPACEAAAALPRLQGERAAVEGRPRDPGLPSGASEGAAPAERFTLSAVDEAALAQGVLPSLRRIAGAVEEYAREDDLRRIGLEVLLGPDRGPLRGTPAFRGGTRDVGLFLDRLASQVTREPAAAGTAGQRAVLDAVASARAAIQRAVIAASFGPRYRTADFAGMAGLSLWLPHDGAELRARADFFAGTALWRAPAGEASFRALLDRILAPPR